MPKKQYTRYVYRAKLQTPAHARAKFDCHFVWATRRLRPVLVGLPGKHLRQLLGAHIRKLGGVVRAMTVSPNHVYLVVHCPANLSPDQVMYRIKRHTARILRGEHPKLRTMPSIWTRNYLLSSKTVPTSIIRQFIAGQKKGII